MTRNADQLAENKVTDAGASFGKKLSWRAQVLVYDALCLLAKPFSFRAVSAAGGALLRAIGPLTSKQKIVDKGLKMAFPDASEAQRKIWSRAQWDNAGRTLFEFLIIGRLKIFAPNSPVTVSGLDHLRRAVDGGKGFVIVTGHFANWEVMAAVMAQAGLPVNITYRHINNPYMDKRVRETRKKYGIKLLVPKDAAKGAKELLRALGRGEGIALMNDQKFDGGLEVPFFGVPAMTAHGPARMALKSDAPLIPISVTRDKAEFHMQVHPPIELNQTGDKADAIKDGVIKVTDFIQARVRENPGQWFWTHRRWDKSLYKD